jgi:hypothetical protein
MPATGSQHLCADCLQQEHSRAAASAALSAGAHAGRQCVPPLCVVWYKSCCFIEQQHMHTRALRACSVATYIPSAHTCSIKHSALHLNQLPGQKSSARKPFPPKYTQQISGVTGGCRQWHGNIGRRCPQMSKQGLPKSKQHLHPSGSNS